MVIAAIDVGRYDDHIGTASTLKDVLVKDENGNFIFFDDLLSKTSKGTKKLAIGFEAPLFIPGNIGKKMTCSRPEIDGNRAWSCTSSFQCLFPVLNQFYATLKKQWGNSASVFTSYEDFIADENPWNVFVFESFISKHAECKGEEFCEGSWGTHDADAKLTITLFEKFEQSCKEKKIKRSVDAGFYETYMSLPEMFAHYHGITFKGVPQSGLIVKSAKPYQKIDKGPWYYNAEETALIVW